jgi:hypothetical protein
MAGLDRAARPAVNRYSFRTATEHPGLAGVYFRKRYR